jgi:hypothetical protein
LVTPVRGKGALSRQIRETFQALKKIVYGSAVIVQPSFIKAFLTALYKVRCGHIEKCPWLGQDTLSSYCWAGALTSVARHWHF